MSCFHLLSFVILLVFLTPSKSVEIFSAIPNWGNRFGGAVVNVSGSGFVNDANLGCIFGGSFVSPATFISTSFLSCTSPALSQLPTFVPDSSNLIRNDSVTLQIRSSGYNSTHSILFFFSEFSSIHLLEPTEGPTYGTTRVSIETTNVLDGPALKCRFGNQVVPAQYISKELLNCVAPPSIVGTEFLSLNTEPKVLGYAMRFDGVNDFLTHGFDQALNLTRDMTFEVWFKLDSLATAQVSSALVENCYPGESYSTNCLYYVEVTVDGGILLGHEYGEGINQQYKFSAGIQAKKWYHLAVVRDSSIKRYTIYLNGVLFNATYDYNVHPEGGPTGLYVGAYYTTLFLNGWMDEMRLWSVVRTQGQIVANMHTKLYGNETGLNGYWPFDDNNGLQTPDLSSHGNDMLLGGSTPAYSPIRDTIAVDGDWSNINLSYTFYEPEIVTNIQPTSGPFEGGTKISVFGNGFRNSSLVNCQFGNTGYAIQAIFVSPNELICESFSSRCGSNSAPITVTSVQISNNGQQFTNSNSTFSFYVTPILSSISPSFGPLNGGTGVIIRGQNIVSGGNMTCKFGNQVVPAIIISPESVSCVAPERGDQSDVVTLEISPNGQQYTTNALLWRYQDLEEIFVNGSSVVGIVFIVVAAILILITIPIGAIAYYSKEKGVIKQSNLVFLFLILIGVVLSYSVVFFWVHRPSNATCMLRIWAGGFGFILITGPLFVKTFWTWKVTADTSKSPHQMALSNRQLITPLLPVIVIEAVILILWSAINPIMPTLKDIKIDSNQVNVVCHSSNFEMWLSIFFVWKGVILLVGAYLAFRTRSVPTAFNESKNITYTIYNGLFVGTLLVPIIFLVDMSPNVRFAISCLTLLWVVTFTLIIMLGTKMWIVFSKVLKSGSLGSDSVSGTQQ